MNVMSLDLVKEFRLWMADALPETIQGAITAVVAVVVLTLVYKISTRLIVRSMTRQKRTPAQIKQFSTVWKYAIMLSGMLFVVMSMSAGLAAMGLTVAFVSMILGWSLQRPVTGVAAWLMVIIKKPFVIGDRIIIQGVKGDVIDISPTHILIGEVGGTVGGEESSNRGILIPNAVLFDQMVINYAVSDESKYILDEVPVRVSYDSDYRLAEQTLIECARAETKDIVEEIGKEPAVRAEFFDSGIMMRVRYQAIAVDRQITSSNIVGRIVDAFSKNARLGFAYPHSAVEYKAVEKASLPPTFKEVEIQD